MEKVIVKLENIKKSYGDKNIIKDLDLLNICYEEKARFGHFQD